MDGAPLPADGLRVPGYAIGERIGAGGFGEVFRARREVIDREVAIKVLHGRYSADPDAVARFVAEARAVNKVSHPGIVEIFDFGVLADGRQYCVMELISGRTLRDLLRERGCLPLAEALPILRGIAEAVDAAHAAGIAHRDLKPDNVFVLDGGGVKLIDFGLAKLTSEAGVTQTGEVFGTPLYMSPEQCRGRNVTVATDRYSFGMLAYHVLTGAPAFQGEALDLALQHLNDAPEPPSKRCAELPARVDAAILALLDKDPAARPATTVAAVDAMAGGARVGRRRRGKLAAIGAVVAVGGVVTAIAFARDDQATATTAWTTRTLRPTIDGTTENPVLTPDGTALLYSDESGWWRFDVDSGVTAPLRLPLDGIDHLAPLPDGRLLAGDFDAPETHLVDPRTQTHELVLRAAMPALSPDGRFFAAWDADRWLVVHELATAETRRLHHLTNGGPGCAPAWSPDGQHLLWGRTGFDPEGEGGADDTYVTRVADGHTRPLSGPAKVAFRRVTGDYFSPIAFLPDGRIVYCADHEPVELRARPLFGGGETRLAVLDPGVSECIVSTAGGRIVATPGYAQPTAGVLPLDRPEGQAATLSYLVGPTHLKPAAVDDESVYAYTSRDHPRTSALDPTRHQPPALRAVSFDTGAITPLPTCPNEGNVLHRDGVLLHASFAPESEGAIVRFLAHETCEVVDEWRFAAGTRFGRPRCRGGWCALPAWRGDDVTVWKLERGRPPIELTHVPRRARPGRGATATPQLEVAIAPDASAIAFIADKQLFLVAAAGGDATPIAFPGQIDGVAWGADPDRFLATGQWVDGGRFAIVSVDRQGARRMIWSSKDTYVPWITTDASGARLVGYMSLWHQEFIVLDSR